MGEHLIGCIECNCWRGGKSAFIVALFDRGHSGAPRWSASALHSTTRRGRQLRPSRDNDLSFQQIADEAFADFLMKHKQPVGLMDSLKESMAVRKPTRSKKR